MRMASWGLRPRLHDVAAPRLNARTATSGRALWKRYEIALRQCRFSFFDDGVEGGRVVDGQFTQALAVELEFGFREAGDEFAVAQAAFATGGVDADDPQLAKFALVCAAIAEGECLG